MIKGFGAKNVEVITFQYAQQHATELKKKASWIVQDLKVKQTLLDTSLIKAITPPLMDLNAQISKKDDELPNTFVYGRNVLFLLYAAIFALRCYLY